MKTHFEKYKRNAKTVFFSYNKPVIDKILIFTSKFP